MWRAASRLWQTKNGLMLIAVVLLFGVVFLLSAMSEELGDWQPPTNFAVFSPTEYAAERTAKLEDAALHRWRTCEPLWHAIPEFLEKPIRDTGECD